ncbi:MAG: hypothetical protein IT162_12310 [Bryobacterales bacterium]|nr:hypothetical protein [Bryobacterales bacterium]
MRRAVLLAFAATSLLHSERLVSWQRRLNLTLLDWESGAGELEILNPSTFRFLRCPSKPCAGRNPATEAVPFQTVETAAAFEVKTSYLEIRVRKIDGGLMVKSYRGVQLLDEVVPAGARPKGLHFAMKSAAATERFYGLGPRTDAELNLRSQALRTSRPLLISSTGYGLWFTATTNYQFDLARTVPDRAIVSAPFPDRLEFFFHYGPTPKEILEENYAVAGWSFAPTMAHTGLLAESAVPKFATKVDPATPLTWLAHASMSGVLVGAAPRTGALSDLLPLLFGDGVISPERRALRPYLYTYFTEAQERGIPMFRPMAMQYPKDPVASARTSQFMLGDELLVAADREIYLPQGQWTDLRTGQLHAGKRTIPVAEAPGLPLFLKNGTILPWERTDGTVELHYFPRLGAEFFISEPGHHVPTQVHASPAADIVRLEIESLVDRRYEWILHHVSNATTIEPAGTPFRYDEAHRRLHVPVSAKAKGDAIVNVTLASPLEEQ